MSNTLNNFRNAFAGIRPNRFLVKPAWPTGVSGLDVGWVYVKGADLPGSTIGQINVGWQGRIVKFSGERVYSDWVIQMYDNQFAAGGGSLRQSFESWFELMDGRNSHQINYDLTAEWIVRYDDMGGVESAPSGGDSSQDESFFNQSIKLWNCFPTDMSPVTLNYDVSDSFAEFTVQMAYDYWSYE